MKKKKIFFIFSTITSSISYLIYKKIKEQNKEKKIILFNSYETYQQLNKNLLLNEISLIKKFSFNKNKCNQIQLFNNGKSLVIKKKNNNISIDDYLKINNFFNNKTINSLSELREEFEWLKCPKNKIIILTPEMLNKKNIKTFSKLRNFYTKFLIINNKELINYLNLKKDKVYMYYPPYLPYVYGNPQLERKNILKEFQKNPLSLILKESIMREEYSINEKNSFDLIGNQVFKLGEINEENIKENLKKNGNHLFIHIKNWNDLNNEQLNNLLKYKGNSFSSVNLTDSKEFSKELNLFKYNQTYDNLIQAFIIVKNDNKEKIYDISYPNMLENLDKYYKNDLKEFDKSKNIKIKMPSFVEEISSNEFIKKVKNDSSFSEIILNIYKYNCPPCFIYGKTFDHLSQKLNFHKINSIKLFKINIDENDIPLIGEFNSAPTFIHISKTSNNLKFKEITPLNIKSFILKLKSVSSINLSKINYNQNFMYGYNIFKNQEFLRKDYNPDIDLL